MKKRQEIREWWRGRHKKIRAVKPKPSTKVSARGIHYARGDKRPEISNPHQKDMPEINNYMPHAIQVELLTEMPIKATYYNLYTGKLQLDHINFKSITVHTSSTPLYNLIIVCDKILDVCIWQLLSSTFINPIANHLQNGLSGQTLILIMAQVFISFFSNF